ncbi:MAG TPA: MRP family ATP-binding protein [Bacteroidetes bacterium]|nr:septum site-determining protein MinD [bacterium BMS3Bbin04]HDO64583.1 MRP family ATP-binding protein [Bacteroidota bacterium]HEX03708.1 MRP family ATP-binding protein [Bacteroidota bacterium]
MSNKQFTAKEIEDLLKGITYPGFSRDIVSFGIVKGIEAEGPQVTVSLEFSTSDETISQKVAEQVGKTLSDAGVEAVDIKVQHHNPQANAGEGEANDAPDLLPGVKHIIAVASGKGGVGKSTIAANLAIGLTKLGLKVGLMDADIYGPSVQMLLNLGDEPEPADGENKLMPIEAYGVKAMSMGVLVDADTPLVWRGPMVSSAVEQLMRDVNWGELDVLVLDMPPGTGDIQLTVSQKVKLTGAVIVTTPQELALIDARKGIGMFQKVGVPVLGLVENMSYFLAPDTGKRYEIFSSGGARKEALRQRVPFLGEIPLQLEIREGSDAGKPVAAQDSPIGELFSQLAEKVWQSVNEPKMQ